MSIMDCFSFHHFDKRIDALERLIIEGLKEIKTTMAQDQAALDTALASLGTLVTSEDTGIAALITAVQALLAKIAANPGADFTSEVTALQSMAADITTQTQSIQAAVASAS